MTDLDHAVHILLTGGLVAFPTETVYGLGADATNPAALRKIFDAKGRPTTNPLICHVADESVARRYASAWPPAAARLARAFWPGPLTLVLPKSPIIAPEATAGRETVGLRAPDHPLALDLLARFGRPLAGPSANRSTRVSPTTADHVRQELGGRIDLILDGGPCRVGIESTVLDLTTPIPMILRPGGVSQAQIESVIGPVDLFHGTTDPSVSAVSPGQHAIHYAPSTPTFRFDADSRGDMESLYLGNLDQPWAFLFVGAGPKSESPSSAQSFALPADPANCARDLYAALRSLDESSVTRIYVEMPPDRPEWLAVRDRLRRATRPLP